MKTATKAELTKLAAHFNDKPLTAAGTPYVVDMPTELRRIRERVAVEAEAHRRARKGGDVNSKKAHNNHAGNTDGNVNHRSTSAQNV